MRDDLLWFVNSLKGRQFKLKKVRLYLKCANCWMLISLIRMESEDGGFEPCLSSFYYKQKAFVWTASGEEWWKIDFQTFFLFCFFSLSKHHAPWSQSVVDTLFISYSAMWCHHSLPGSFRCHCFPQNRCVVARYAFHLHSCFKIWSPYYSLEDMTACLLANTLCAS